jgi:glycosyltransferase involved in cell wall biosynthesis
MRMALVDFGSHVIFYDYYLAKGLLELGHQVVYFGSETKFNNEYLEALRNEQGCSVISKPVSRSVSSRLRGIGAYISLVRYIWRNRKDYDRVNLQFCTIWPVEIILFWFLRKKFIYTVHNAIPHDFSGYTYWPFRLFAYIADEIWFPSEATAESFYCRYSQCFRTKGKVVQIGTMGVYPGCPLSPYRLTKQIEGVAYWGNIKPYKGIDLMLDLVRRRAASNGNDVIEVYGRWLKELHPIRDEIRLLNGHVEDRFLSTDELTLLLSRDLVFLLPYKSASQSGALYTLLHHGRFFMATDTGDLGAFLRRFGLEGLILKDATVESVDQCMAWLKCNLSYAVSRFTAAQSELSWSNLLLAAGIGREDAVAGQ